jgi:hypothetical protein
MQRTLIVTIILSMLALSSSGVEAASKRHHLHYPQAETAAPSVSGTFDPPRMIEVRPGYWTSTYDECGDACEGGGG